MNYAEARPKIRSGDLLAWGHEAWRTWHDFEVQAVRMFTRSEFSHVGVALRLGPRLFVVEAVVPEVRIFPLSRLLPFYWLRGEVRVSWSSEHYDAALNIVGQPYSKLEAIKSFFGKVVPGANTLWQCAETAAFLRSKLLMADFKNPTPTSLVKDAMERGAHQLLIRGNA